MASRRESNSIPIAPSKSLRATQPRARNHSFIAGRQIDRDGEENEQVEEQKERPGAPEEQEGPPVADGNGTDMPLRAQPVKLHGTQGNGKTSSGKRYKGRGNMDGNVGVSGQLEQAGGC